MPSVKMTGDGIPIVPISHREIAEASEDGWPLDTASAPTIQQRLLVWK
jgi:hypothetical protein